MSTMSPAHVPCATEWPALTPSKIATHDPYEADGDWELLPEPQDRSVETSFEQDAVRIVESNQVKQNGKYSSRNKTETLGNALCSLKHAQSTPDFRTVLEESDDDVEAILVGSDGLVEEDDGCQSLESSSMVFISGPPSVVSAQSCWSTSSKVSFKDAILKEKAKHPDDKLPVPVKQVPKPMKIKPKFVVKPIKRCAKSMVDLRSLDRIAETNEDDVYSNGAILGDTDAQLYYNQKAQGVIGRKNGRKTRPDEAKRLQITMAKKEDQRQRQKAAAMKKR